MSPFLSRLVARTRGTAPVVEPLIQPQYAPRPARVAESLGTASGGGAPPPPAADSPRSTVVELIAPLERDAARPSPQRRESEREAHVSSEQPRVATRVPHLPEQETHRSANEPLLVQQGVSKALPIHKPPPIPSQQNAAIPERSGRRGAPPSAVREAARALLNPAPPSTEQSPAPEPEGATAPIVRVTIGRIEVRAISSPPPPVRSRPVAKPALTLEAYLDSRKNGAR
jgi:hypothetical protein